MIDRGLTLLSGGSSFPRLLAGLFGAFTKLFTRRPLPRGGINRSGYWRFQIHTADTRLTTEPLCSILSGYKN